MEETLKTAWEAFKSDVKTRLGIAIGFSIFLLCRKYIETLSGGKELFSVLAVPSFLICIIFWVTILLDIDEKELSPMAARVFAWSIARIKNA